MNVKPNDEPDLLSIYEAATRLGRHPEYMRELARKGKLAGAHKFFGRWVWSPAEYYAAQANPTGEGDDA